MCHEDLTGVAFQAHDLLRDVSVNGAGEPDVAGAEMDLHEVAVWGGWFRRAAQ